MELFADALIEVGHNLVVGQQQFAHLVFDRAVDREDDVGIDHLGGEKSSGFVMMKPPQRRVTPVKALSRIEHLVLDGSGVRVQIRGARSHRHSIARADSFECDCGNRLGDGAAASVAGWEGMTAGPAEGGGGQGRGGA